MDLVAASRNAWLLVKGELPEAESGADLEADAIVESLSGGPVTPAKAVAVLDQIIGYCNSRSKDQARARVSTAVVGGQCTAYICVGGKTDGAWWGGE